MKAKDQPIHRKYRGQKIYTYVSQADVERLQTIAETYGFNTIYQLQKYLVDCFLRVVDPSNDTNTEPVPHAIAEIFIHPREYRRIKRLAKKEKKGEFQVMIPFGEFVTKQTRKAIINDQGVQMADEIKDMFDIHSDWEAEPTTRSSNYDGMNVKQKADQRKYKTPDDLTP